MIRGISVATGLGLAGLTQTQPADCWIYRDDIGAWWGIKGYEEQVTEVGSHHGHNDWSAFRFLSTYDAASVRRGF